MASIHWPSEMRLKQSGRLLSVAFEDAHFDLSAEYLRVSSPSAEVQGHSAAERKTVAGKRAVAILAIDPVGHYAVRLTFSDGHDSGLFTWDYLYELGCEFDTLWSRYLNELESKKLSRG